jgi:predicted dehydrogenase
MGRRWYGRTGRVSSPVKHSPIARLGGFGWDGPWRDAMRHALDYFRKYFVNVDATVVSVVDVDGKVSDPRFDLYDQAFALLAYASGHSGFGEAADWRRRAVTLRRTLVQFYAHPLGGFREGRDGQPPQRANPHMHAPSRSRPRLARARRRSGLAGHGGWDRHAMHRTIHRPRDWRVARVLRRRLVGGARDRGAHL